jgi:prepilin-type N-terminal cleavage/methylation domain-containing protein
MSMLATRAGRPNSARSADERGFTAIEMTVAVFVLGIVMATAMGFMSSALLRGTATSEQTVLQAETRQVFDQFVIEMRQATSGMTGVVAIETMQAGTIQFLSPNSATPYGMRRISYTVASGELRRTEITSTDTDGYPWVFGTLPAYSKVLGSVRNTTVFRYLDDNGAVTAVPAAVQTIEISLDIDPFPSISSSPKTYKTAVHPRSIQ